MVVNRPAWQLKFVSAAELPPRPWDGQTIVVGRDAACDVAVDDAGVSRRHARLTIVERKLHVEDLHSANGTWHRRQRVDQATLPLPAELYMGETFRVCVEKRIPDKATATQRLTALRLALVAASLTMVIAIVDDLRSPVGRVRQSATDTGSLPPLPLRDPANQFAWAEAQIRDASFVPGALAWAIRGFADVAAGDNTLSTAAGARADMLGRELTRRLRSLEFEARRALASGDLRQARAAAARLAQEARPIDAAAGLTARQLLGHSRDAR